MNVMQKIIYAGFAAAALASASMPVFSSAEAPAASADESAPARPARTPEFDRR